MHRSRLTSIQIDTLSRAYDETVSFWGRALGVEPEPVGSRDRYTRLRGSALDVLIQRVDADSGLHLDIETDDVDAEVARLEALGARRKRQVRGWWVMEDPAGHAFCVVSPVSADWPAGANEW